MKSKIIKYETSIYAEIDLLKDIITNPQNYTSNQKIINSLETQNSFSRYENIDLKIISMSLNTHKFYCNSFLLNGYNSLNELRIKSLDLLNQISKNSTTNSSKNKIDKLESRIDELMKHNLLLTRIIYDMKYSLEGLSLKTNDPKFKAEIKFKLSNYEKILSFSKENI
ncbi:hypothetical protein [Acinetobacter baumannii]|uniref:hypothetical protein n=1 Tax=Acinetobacter baumannii TaxID=470 RepID=UPI0034D01AD5|nr:hypothetical protein [Acinetobacter baumannii]HAV5688761.1 hypothetical protein [Acinetobacter baumannii]HAV5700751.1 hypothetical protein [Acinetobacter baumannii]HAV5727955.1 hypothetical protein [Acinetobacter baumannii]HAV5731782.1 hypothetical protein [Acinetobacter baumannii]